MKNENTWLIFLFYVNEFKVAHCVTDTEKVSFFTVQEKQQILYLGSSRLKYLWTFNL